jgi:ATP-dependent helicase/nuclease subunit A
VPPPVRVIVSDDHRSDSVSVSPFLSETDQLEREREQHETRRLLYVAMTRARDRLYLSSALKDGALHAGKGALAEVLPDSLKSMFAAAAATAGDEIIWTSPTGRSFTWRLCRLAADSGSASTGNRVPNTEQTISEGKDLPVLGVPPSSASLERLTVSAWLAREYPDQSPTDPGPAPHALVGSLVHRLFQLRVRAGDDPVAAARAAMRMEERATLDDPEAVVAAAAGIWSGLREREDVSALMSAATVFTEVPFSMRLPADGSAVIVRGTIDCVAIDPDGSVTVVEFKTGAPRPSHQAQLDVYVSAAREAFPGASVRGRLIYNSVARRQV